MKRLLCSGYPDIYSICRVFRDGESGQQHQPEFTMIEWYRLGFGLREIIDDTLGLIGAALEADIADRTAICHDYRDCFLQTLGIDPLVATIEELRECLKRRRGTKEGARQRARCLARSAARLPGRPDASPPGN